jgi:hypothetical protein
MTTYFRRNRAVTAVMRDDGTVYFDLPATKPVSEKLLDWTLRSLWAAVVVVLVATIFSK